MVEPQFCDKLVMAESLHCDNFIVGSSQLTAQPMYLFSIFYKHSDCGGVQKKTIYEVKSLGEALPYIGYMGMC